MIMRDPSLFSIASMEIQIPSIPYLLTCVFSIAIVLKIWRSRSTSSSSRDAVLLPPGPGKLPFLGNLHLFIINTLPHHCLRDLAKLYGPIMHLQLGEIPVYIVSSKLVALDVLQNHNNIFSSRSTLHALKLITYNYTDIVMAPYGTYLRHIRQVGIRKLFNSTRVSSLASIREEEVSNVIEFISSKARSGSAINISKMLLSLALSINSRAAFGGKSEHQDEYQEMVPDITALSARPSLSDLFPTLKFLHLIHVFNEIRPDLRRLHRRIDEILQGIIDEHEANIQNGWNEQSDLLYSLLLDADQLETPLTRENIKAVMMDILTNAETSSTTLEWAMAELMKNPEIMERAQREVRRIFPERVGVDEARIDELNYLDSVIKETLRLHPPIPLMAPRESSEGCAINGYDIPAKSWVIINIWAMGRDPSYWDDAETFLPDRFLVNGGGSDDYLPFGAGARRCPGQKFGIAMLKITIANLLYHFDWGLPDGLRPENLDMTEVFVTSAPRKHALRLVPHLAF